MKTPILWTQNDKAHTDLCVSLANPCINILAPPSVTRKYHPNVLELLHLLQCIAAHLQHTLHWVCRDIAPRCFSAVFHSGSVARSRKPIECMPKNLLRRCQQQWRKWRGGHWCEPHPWQAKCKKWARLEISWTAEYEMLLQVLEIRWCWHFKYWNTAVFSTPIVIKWNVNSKLLQRRAVNNTWLWTCILCVM